MDNSCAPNSIHSVAGAGNNTWPRFPSTLFRSLLTAALLLLAMAANLAHALKLGEAQVRSTQGQWLDIYIPVADAKQLELLDLHIKQIRAADAAGLGFSDAIDDPEYLLDLLSDGRGKLWVSVTSVAPVEQADVHLVIQLESNAELLQREYSLSVPAEKVLQSSYVVKSGDSLGRIGQAIRPDPAIALKAITQYLHANNLQAFTRGDINRIVVGATLQLPTAADFERMPRRQLATATQAPIQSNAKATAAVNTASPQPSKIAVAVIEPVSTPEQVPADTLDEQQAAEETVQTTLLSVPETEGVIKIEEPLIASGSDSQPEVQPEVALELSDSETVLSDASESDTAKVVVIDETLATPSLESVPDEVSQELSRKAIALHEQATESAAEGETLLVSEPVVEPYLPVSTLNTDKKVAKTSSTPAKRITDWLTQNLLMVALALAVFIVTAYAIFLIVRRRARVAKVRELEKKLALIQAKKAQHQQALKEKNKTSKLVNKATVAAEKSEHKKSKTISADKDQENISAETASPIETPSSVETVNADPEAEVQQELTTAVTDEKANIAVEKKIAPVDKVILHRHVTKGSAIADVTTVDVTTTEATTTDVIELPDREASASDEGQVKRNPFDLEVESLKIVDTFYRQLERDAS